MIEGIFLNFAVFGSLHSFQGDSNQDPLQAQSDCCGRPWVPGPVLLFVDGQDRAPDFRLCGLDIASNGDVVERM